MVANQEPRTRAEPAGGAGGRPGPKAAGAMMAKIVLGTGRAQVEISDDLQGPLEDALREATRGASDVMRDKTKEVFKGAVREWPVKTGRSRDELQHLMRIDGNTLRAGVSNRNTRGYAQYIRSDGVHAMTAYIRRPMERGAVDLARDLGDDAVSKLSGGGR